MQDYSKILTERGLTPRVSGQEIPPEANDNPYVTEIAVREQREGRQSRFGQPHAWLFPFLGRKVRTPSGPGTLLQVFAERVAVALDTELSKCAVFTPQEIAPCDWRV